MLGECKGPCDGGEPPGKDDVPRALKVDWLWHVAKNSERMRGEFQTQYSEMPQNPELQGLTITTGGTLQLSKCFYRHHFILSREVRRTGTRPILQVK